MNSLYITQILSVVVFCALSGCDREKTSSSLDGRPISQIEFRLTGETFVDEHRLRNLMHTKPGDTFTPDAINLDVKALYESGLVDDVRFLAEPDGNSLQLVAEVSTRPSFGPPFCIGNTAYSDMRLVVASDLTKQRPTTVEELEKARQKLKIFYVSRGYVDADVVCRAFQGGHPAPEDYIFVVDEGATIPQPSTDEKEEQQDAAGQPANRPESK